MALQDDLTTIKNNLDGIDSDLTADDTSVTNITNRVTALLANQVTPDQLAAISALASQSTASKTHEDTISAALTTLGTTAP